MNDMTSSDEARQDAEARQAIVDDIEKFGCHLTAIDADNYLPGFVYSIGLFKKFNHPEIICFGLKTDVMAAIINHACDLIKQGQALKPYVSYSGFLEGFDIQFVPVNKTYYPDYLGYAGWFYDMSFDFDALQLIWPDKTNKFPWEIGFNSDWKFKQPILDRGTDFKFYEEKNLAVLTTKQVFSGSSILHAYHHKDGGWQFHTSLNADIADAVLVSLKEIVKLDPAVNELFRLQYGWKAWRKSTDHEWEFEAHPEEEE